MSARQVIQFTITAYVEPEHEAYDDPEWVADAAAGALANLYGAECTYGDIEATAGENLA